MPATTDRHPTPAADDFRNIAAHFSKLVDGVASSATWDRPSPVQGWSARDVVGHLVEWFPAFLEHGSGISLPHGPSIEHDPAAAWAALRVDVQSLLDDPTTANAHFRDLNLGELTVSQAVAQFFTDDVFMHSWDLARATGQNDTLDPDRCRRLLAQLSPHDVALRRSGHYGARVDVPDDADPQTKLLAFIGRHT